MSPAVPWRRCHLSRDERIDAYIAKAKPFAQPILTAIRHHVHAAFPDVEETVKWGAPAYCKDGKILLVSAAFKAHAAVNFWRGKEMGLTDESEAMGQLGKLKSLADIPSDFENLVRQAIATSDKAPAKNAEPKPEAELHPEFAKALITSPKAKATLDNFPPGKRRDYIEWINEAKRDTTRTKRIETAVEWLAEGKSRHWKYQDC